MITKFREGLKNIEARTFEYINKIINENGRLTGILFFIYLIAFSSILRADFNYADDIMRKYIGYHGWMDWSRWTTTILSNVMHADWDLIDISPFPQIIACLFLAVSSLMLVKVFSKTGKVSFMNLLASLAVGLCPYFFGCISFKYDSPYMAMSIMVSILPFLFRKSGYKKFYIISLICLLLMITTYQTSSGIYPTIVVFLAVDMFCEDEELKDIGKFIGVSMLAFVSALLIFAFILMQPGDTAIVPVNRILSTIVYRYIDMYRLVAVDFRKLWLFFIGLAGLFYLYEIFCETKRNKIVSVLLGCAASFLSSVFVWNVMLIMSRDSIDARGMLGLGTLIAIIFIKLSCLSRPTLSKLCFLIVNWCFFVYALAYGNAMKEQGRYTDFRMQVLISDLNTLDYNEKELKCLGVTGDIGYSPVITKMNNHYDYVRKLLSYNVQDDPSFLFGEGFYLYNYFGLNTRFTYDEVLDFEKLNLPLVIDNMYETVYANDEYVYVKLKK
ncbi:glucosyltransferase domain-containing protein [Butyrivibrio sp. XBB1001]|uniref:glucosyltransferase domain-containing protein n=1 Tax=Butyrivibrio sp. XBB1001 TaxID=1280682 RepID=UPI0003F8FE77|nr:glucosyltransferase domain-containing protein [Butyrivibrio sp. XBB1001]